jgi:DNA-binding NarL/FixJ family response regulator
VTDTIRILIADDDALVRAGLKLILGAHPELMVVGEAPNGKVAVHMFRDLLPDVVLMDIRMPERSGLSATEEILRTHPSANIVVLTTFDTDEFVVRALKSGARGFLLKDTEPAELVRSVRVAAAGQATLSPSVITQLVAQVPEVGVSNTAGTNKTGDPSHGSGAVVHPSDRARRDENAYAHLLELTDRELDVARAVAVGMSNSQIAEHLFLSVPTVKTHLSRVFDKLGVDNRVQVALTITAAKLNT